jgi:1-acyl-sn-glycerol-3-phosphate acyltransferase
LLPFKNGAFKMAYKAGAPIVPLSIIGSGKAMPSNWMFPRFPTHGCQVVIHEPIESEGKTEDELAEEVRAAIISGLPEDQRPLPEKPKKKSAPPVPAPVEPSPSPAPQE